MRTNEQYLKDIVDAADAVAKFISTTDKDAFCVSDLLLSAVQMKLAIMGETTSRLSKDFREQHPAIAWNKIAAYRNFAMHAYFAVEPRVIWDTATIHAPVTRQQVLSILTSEFPA